jgi:hypothetical protein
MTDGERLKRVERTLEEMKHFYETGAAVGEVYEQK